MVGAVVATMGYSSIRPTGWKRLRPPSTTSPDAPPSSQGEGGVKSFVVGVGEIGGKEGEGECVKEMSASRMGKGAGSQGKREGPAGAA